MIDWMEYLHRAVEDQASDVFFVAGSKVCQKREGHLVPVGTENLLSPDTLQIAREIYEKAGRDWEIFEKTGDDADVEDDLFHQWVNTFPEPQRAEWTGLLAEMEAQETKEAKLYKALDKLEALISHNESDINSWLPLEYDLQFTYGQENMKFSPYLKELRAAVDDWSREKIERES